MFLKIEDITNDDWAAGWESCSGCGDDQVWVNVASWADSQIVITGFTGQYGGIWQYNPGDTVVISVWNPQSSLGPAQFTVFVSN